MQKISLMKRAPTNIATDCAAHWTAAPATIIDEPMNKVTRRPNVSEAKGVKGFA